MIGTMLVTPHVAGLEEGCTLWVLLLFITLSLGHGRPGRATEEEWPHGYLSLAQAEVPLSNHLLQQQAEGGVLSFPKAGHLLSTLHRALLLGHLPSL